MGTYQHLISHERFVKFLVNIGLNITSFNYTLSVTLSQLFNVKGYLFMTIWKTQKYILRGIVRKIKIVFLSLTNKIKTAR